MKLTQILADIICNTLLDPDALNRARRQKGAFTRNCKKLPYWSLVKLLLANVKCTISASLDHFFHELRLKSGVPSASCSQQAFSKARSKISHSIFKEAFERTLDFLCSHDSLAFHARFLGVWGRQIIAIDGSKIPLPNRKALLDQYGSIGRGSSSPTAIASVAFDVLNDRILDAQFGSIHVDERSLAIKHMDHIKSKARTNLLYTMFVFDRGYASKELIAYIEDTIHAAYLFRLRSKFNHTIDALPAPTDQYGTTDRILYLNDRKIRVLKFYLPSGTLETLITNDFDLDKDLFRQCYFLRWDEMPISAFYPIATKTNPVAACPRCHSFGFFICLSLRLGGYPFRFCRRHEQAETVEIFGLSTGL